MYRASKVKPKAVRAKDKAAVKAKAVKAKDSSPVGINNARQAVRIAKVVLSSVRKDPVNSALKDLANNVRKDQAKASGQAVKVKDKAAKANVQDKAAIIPRKTGRLADKTVQAKAPAIVRQEPGSKASVRKTDNKADSRVHRGPLPILQDVPISAAQGNKPNSVRVNKISTGLVKVVRIAAPPYLA